MSLKETEIFRGELSVETRSSMLRALARRGVDYKAAFRPLEDSGLRDMNDLYLDAPYGETELRVRERGFWDMTEHSLTVGLAAATLGKLVDLSNDEQQDLFVAGTIHDATKRAELITENTWYQLRQNGSLTDEEKEAFEKNIRIIGLVNDEHSVDEVIGNIKTMTALELKQYINGNITDQFLKKMLEKHSSLPKDRQERILEIAQSSGWPSPKLIAQVTHFTESNNMPSIPAMEEFRDFVEGLRMEDKLPDVDGDRTDYLATINWYCDAITSGKAITLVDTRFGDLKASGRYKDIVEETISLYGKDSNQVSRIVAHAIEEIVKPLAVENGNMHEDIPSSDLPIVIFSNLKEM